MALKTTAEKADELSILVPSLSLRLDYLEKKIDSALKAQNDTNQSVLELREELINVKRDIADLAKWKDAQNAAQSEKSRRLWALTPNLLAAIITVAGGIFNIFLAALIAYAVSKKP